MKRRMKHRLHGSTFLPDTKHRPCGVCDHCECHAVHTTECPPLCPYPEEHHEFVEVPA